jgi:hypothetical protein
MMVRTQWSLAQTWQNALKFYETSSLKHWAGLIFFFFLSCTIYFVPKACDHCPWRSSQFNKWHAQNKLHSSLIVIWREQPALGSLPPHTSEPLSLQGLFVQLLPGRKMHFLNFSQKNVETLKYRYKLFHYNDLYDNCIMGMIHVIVLLCQITCKCPAQLYLHLFADFVLAMMTMTCRHFVCPLWNDSNKLIMEDAKMTSRDKMTT